MYTPYGSIQSLRGDKVLSDLTPDQKLLHKNEDWTTAPFLPPSLHFLQSFSFPVDEDRCGDEGGEEEHDPRRLFLHRPRVGHVLEAVQGRLLFREREIESVSGFVREWLRLKVRKAIY